eukprot:gnl/TRDRNA2_/TRDRNA2_30779_c0_seq1.p1 gnl/TRDRNA2_/TRDRNA2_30779_c0~~gnl/TRDRNA2_/TRDRNA2_30779_c0_seq1.p1  ORF type:complete len:514 (+),score=71.76 gnl/TRDRNA2_/TRDRNA2_30779_c0_seq1:86-1627(+)
MRDLSPTLAEPLLKAGCRSGGKDLALLLRAVISLGCALLLTRAYFAGERPSSQEVNLTAEMQELVAERLLQGRRLRREKLDSTMNGKVQVSPLAQEEMKKKVDIKLSAALQGATLQGKSRLLQGKSKQLGDKIRVLSGEALMCHILVMWQMLDPKFHGIIGEESEKIPDPFEEAANISESFKGSVKACSLHSIHKVFEPGAVTTFADMLGRKNRTKMSMDKLRSWYTRMKLRYSGASLAAAFVNMILPGLKQKGLTHLSFPALQEFVDLDDLQAYAVTFEPKERYMFEYRLGDTLDPRMKMLLEGASEAMKSVPQAKDVAMQSLNSTVVDEKAQKLLDQSTQILTQERTQEIVEMHQPSCVHHVFYSPKLGVVLDLSGGQYTGNMLPEVYPDLEAFKAAFPGTVISFDRSDEQELKDQTRRDLFLAKSNKIPPPEFMAQRVVNISTQRGGSKWDAMCRACLGVADYGPGQIRSIGHPQVTYCSKLCQDYDYPRYLAEARQYKETHRQRQLERR